MTDDEKWVLKIYDDFFMGVTEQKLIWVLFIFVEDELSIGQCGGDDPLSIEFHWLFVCMSYAWASFSSVTHQALALHHAHTYLYSVHSQWTQPHILTDYLACNNCTVYIQHIQILLQYFTSQENCKVYDETKLTANDWEMQMLMF